MSLCFSICFLLCFLRVHGNNWIRPQSSPFLYGFELPEIDGSAVDDTCKIVDTGSNTSPTTTKATTRPVTRQQMVIITKRPVVQSSQRKPVTKAPIRTRPAAGGPIRNHNTNNFLELLHSLLANSRGRLAGSQPMRGLDVMSSSEESMAVWKIGAVTSEDSSDES